MELTTIVEKNVEDLSDEEKAFLKENKEKLNDKQKEEFASVLVEASAGGEGGEGGGE